MKCRSVITSEKILVFFKYRGDSDLLQRVGHRQDTDLFMHDDWHVIDTLLMEIALVKNGRASALYASKIRARLKAVTVDDTAANLLWNRV